MFYALWVTALLLKEKFLKLCRKRRSISCRVAAAAGVNSRSHSWAAKSIVD